jgi:hypothetical protein
LNAQERDKVFNRSQDLRCWRICMPILLALSVFGGGGGSAAAGPTVTATGPLDTATGKKIAAGSYHTCTRLDNGQVKCWGVNNFGQLGLGDTNNRGDHADEMGNNLPAVDFGQDAGGTLPAF